MALPLCPAGTGLRNSFELRLKASAAQPSAEKHTVLFIEKFAGRYCKFFFTPYRGEERLTLQITQ